MNKAQTMSVSTPRGIYQHYKGSLYEVLELATHSETDEKLVVYRTLYGKYDVWVRPLDMFTQSVNKNGQKVPRFALIKAF